MCRFRLRSRDAEQPHDLPSGRQWHALLRSRGIDLGEIINARVPTSVRKPSLAKVGGKWIFSWVVAPSVAIVALAASSHSQSLLDVSLTYLQRHEVPCQSVVKVDSTDQLDEVATCQDGREWVLLWLENEIAFVHPGSRELYRWRREAYISYPSLYGASKPNVKTEAAGGGAGP
jgi:hypothetical protein